MEEINEMIDRVIMNALARESVESQKIIVEGLLKFNALLERIVQRTEKMIAWRKHMKQINTPKRPWIFNIIIAAIVLLLLNTLIVPYITEQFVKEVDYGTFIDMLEAGEIAGSSFGRYANNFCSETRRSDPCL